MEVSTSARVLLNDFLASIEKRAFVRAKLATSNSDEALDIVQDAMINMAQRYGQNAQDEWPLLFNRILERQIVDWYRRQSVRNRWRIWLDDKQVGDEQTVTLDKVTLDTVTDDGSDLASQLMSQRSIECLLLALEQLPLRQQQAFLLRSWEGLSVAETAQVMGCSQGSVKTHLARANQQLRQAIREYPHE